MGQADKAEAGMINSLQRFSPYLLLFFLAVGAPDTTARDTADEAAPRQAEAPGTEDRRGGGEDGGAPREEVPEKGAPPEMVTPPGQEMSGWEAFISIGGVNGRPEPPVQKSLVKGYQRAGFRVHYVEMAMSFDPFAIKMAEVANEYRASGRDLEYVVFHHTGHGWDDHISYETAPPDVRRGSTDHNEVAVGLGVLFPKASAEFDETLSGLVYDACGQGGATDHTVRDRHGVVVTATPPAAPAGQCAANDCTYICEACWTQTVPTYTYSQAFGRALLKPPGVTFVDEALQAAHNAGGNAIRQQGSPSGCEGVFRRY